jgi:hypothetical protein
MGQPQGANGWQTAAGDRWVQSAGCRRVGRQRVYIRLVAEGFQARALGGDVDASSAYLVGEQGTGDPDRRLRPDRDEQHLATDARRVWAEYLLHD